MLVSAVQQTESAICIHISPPSWTSLPLLKAPTGSMWRTNVGVTLGAGDHSEAVVIIQANHPSLNGAGAGNTERWGRSKARLQEVIIMIVIDRFP